MLLMRLNLIHGVAFAMRRVMLQMRKDPNGVAQIRKESSMTKSDITTRAQAILEEELGEFRAFADLSASEIETIAARLTRALEPLLLALPVDEPHRNAA